MVTLVTGRSASPSTDKTASVMHGVCHVVIPWLVDAKVLCGTNFPNKGKKNQVSRWMASSAMDF